jgi:hypothetical protein
MPVAAKGGVGSRLRYAAANAAYSTAGRAEEEVNKAVLFLMRIGIS